MEEAEVPPGLEQPRREERMLLGQQQEEVRPSQGLAEGAS